jgi:spore photoproduct lyase
MTVGGREYSHIYVEQGAHQWPDTAMVIDRFPDAVVVEIDSASELFNRRQQHFQAQKRSPKLILAVDRGPFIFEGSERVKSFGDRKIYYTVPMRNCVYNCDYCFLQGMHPSANLLVTVNGPEAMEAAAQQYRKDGGYFLSISYLTDLLGFESIIPYCRRWIDFAREHPLMTVEIRTKSDNIAALSGVNPAENVVLVWSLSPESVSRDHERGAASFRNRLLCARTAQRAGWRIRLCFDPVLRVDRWQQLYRECIHETFRRLDPAGVEMVSYGVFRLHGDFLDRLRKVRPDSTVIQHPYQRVDGLSTYRDTEIEEVCALMERELRRILPGERINFVHG